MQQGTNWKKIGNKPGGDGSSSGEISNRYQVPKLDDGNYEAAVQKKRGAKAYNMRENTGRESIFKADWKIQRKIEL